MNDSEPLPSSSPAGRADPATHTAAPAVPAVRPPGSAASRGSDPPKDSGHPAAREAGKDAPATGPSAPSEIDRSTDA